MNKRTRSHFILVVSLVLASMILASCNLPAGTGPGPVAQASPTLEQQALASPTAGSGETTDIPAITDTPAPTDTAATATSTATPTPTGGPTSGPCDPASDQAKFVADVTYPDDTVVKNGEKITKTWKVQNTGGCTWDANYKLTFIRGEQMDGTSPAAVITAPVKPNDIVELSVPMTAPKTNGTHFGVWQLFNADGKPVNMAGGKPQEVTIKIVVNDGTGGKVTSVRGWRYTYDGGKCTSTSQYDIWMTIYVNGQFNANITWSATNGGLTTVTQVVPFAAAGSQEVTTHLSPPYTNPNNITITLSVTGGPSTSFTLCP